ncbi:MAG: M20/M25/M40 family metallo-hydrolase [Candidatus Promineofilum sp.]|nr:M20/M25/M40 family metallo-hydrolase [Promineifilum sp.]
MSLTPIHTDIRSYLERNLHVYLDLLHQMVAINSFTLNPKGVNGLGKLTADLFLPLSFMSEFYPSTDFRYGRHLVLTRVGRRGPDGPARAIGLISHLDTVYPAAEEEANDFHFRIEGDRIYGPGTVDIKGGTVMIYMVLDALRQFYPEVFDGITWRILLNAAEEVLSPDFGELSRRTLDDGTLAALVFEGGDAARKGDGEEGHYRLVTARKGMARYRVTVNGRGAHAGAYHRKGANAIVQLADVIREIHDFTDYDRDLTFNVGTMMGGTVINRVPHEAAASLEMRAFDPVVFEGGVDRMLALNDYCTVRSSEDGYPCTVRVDVEGRWAPWPPNDGTQGLFDIWNAAAAELEMGAIGPQARGGLSDGNWLWDSLPTIDGLGPEGDNSHSSERSADGSKEQEYVRVSSFVPKALLNVAAIVRLVEESGVRLMRGI